MDRSRSVDLGFGSVRSGSPGEPFYSMDSRRHLKKLSMIILPTLSIRR